ncbi:MAG: hypothetical protein RID23_17745 [Roseovarius sp.]
MSAPVGISLGAVCALWAGAALALTPMPPCDGEENGMMTHDVEYLGDETSGFTIETYLNKTSADGIVAGAPGPIPQLDNFNGVRVTDCRSGHFVAIHGVGQREAYAALTATEFLRPRLKAGQAVRTQDVRRAADALYGGESYVRVLTLRETEETCACREFYPGHWQQ